MSKRYVKWPHLYLNSCPTTIQEETFQPETYSGSSPPPGGQSDKFVERVYEEISEDHFPPGEKKVTTHFQRELEFAKKFSEDQLIDERFHIDLPHSLLKKRQEAAAAANKKNKGFR